MKSPRDRVLTWRLKKHLTQQEVADNLGVARSYIARLESGNCQMSVNLAKAYAEEMKCKWHTLIG